MVDNLKPFHGNIFLFPMHQCAEIAFDKSTIKLTPTKLCTWLLLLFIKAPV